MLPSRDGAPRGAEAVSPCVGQAIERLRRARGGPIEERRKAETALACLYADHPGQRDAIVRELMPIVDNVANRFYRGGESVVEALAAARAMRTLSLNTEAPTEGGAGASDAAQIDPGELEEGYRLVEDRLAMEQITQSLVDRDRLMLQLRFRHDLSQGAIGEHVGVSQMQVSRCLRRIFTDLEPAVADW